MTLTLNYPIVRNKPIADFRYKGSHAKPVRRRIAITGIDKGYFTGYQLREGNETFDLESAEIRTFDRTKIQDGTLSRLSLKDVGLES